VAADWHEVMMPQLIINLTICGGAENDGRENGRPPNCPGMNLADMKLTD